VGHVAIFIVGAHVMARDGLVALWRVNVEIMETALGGPRSQLNPVSLSYISPDDDLRGFSSFESIESTEEQ